MTMTMKNRRRNQEERLPHLRNPPKRRLRYACSIIPYSGAVEPDVAAQEEANKSDLEEIPLPSDDEDGDSGAENAKPAKKKPGPKPKSIAEKAEKTKLSSKAKDKKKGKATAEETDGGVVSGHDDGGAPGAKRKVCVVFNGRVEHIHEPPSMIARCAESEIGCGGKS